MYLSLTVHGGDFGYDEVMCVRVFLSSVFPLYSHSGASTLLLLSLFVFVILSSPLCIPFSNLYVSTT
jgi:hypothetical protein